MNEIDKVQEANTAEEMRAEILRLRRHIPMVRQVMDLADYKGVSAEDRFTILAYNILRQNEVLQRLVLDYRMTHVIPMVIIPGCDLSGD